MAQRTTLTEQQVGLLRWIADGCPDGVMDNDWHRISAAALRRRGLAKVSGKGATWNAIITDAGRSYLASVDSADPPMARQANVSVTQQLMDEVVAAGGVLRSSARATTTHAASTGPAAPGWQSVTTRSPKASDWSCPTMVTRRRSASRTHLTRRSSS